MYSRNFLTSTLTVLAMFTCGILFAQDSSDKQSEAEKQEAEIVAALDIGGGPFLVKRTKQGEIISMAFVGSNRISTTLGVSKGKEIAKQRATLKAKGAFSKWLKEEITVVESASDETLLMLQGSEEDSGDTFSESGKSLETTSSQYKTFSNGILRAMRPIAYDIYVDEDTNEKEYRVMLYWSKTDSDAAKKLKANLDSDDVVSDKPAIKRPKTNKTVKPKRVIILP